MRLEGSGWPLYQVALSRLTPRPAVTFEEITRPGALDWPVLSAWLETTRSLLPMLREASRRTHWGEPYDRAARARGWLDLYRRSGDAQKVAQWQEILEEARSRPGFYASADSLDGVIGLGSLLLVAAREAPSSGDLAAAIAHLADGLAMGRQLNGRFYMLDQRIGSILIEMSASELRRLVRCDHSPLSPALIHQLEVSPFSRFNARPLAEVAQDQRTLDHARLQAAFAAGLDESLRFHPLGRRQSQGLWGRIRGAGFAAVHAGLTSSLATYDAIWERALSGHDARHRWGWLDSLRFAVVKFLDPSASLHRRAQIQADISRQANACRELIEGLRSRP